MYEKDTNLEDVVCYELLRPAQAVARRCAFPLAYLPVGPIEFHGTQNPLGLDGLQAHGVCVQAAKRGGGVVFPVVWYGENRSSHLAEVNPPGRELIAKEMQLPPENFGPATMGGRSAVTQAIFYQELLFHIYYQIHSLGFKAIYVLIGHGPLLQYVALTADVFERATGVKVDFSYTTDLVEGFEQDHGGRVETGTMMALQPELVDLSQLPEGDASQLVGLAGQDPREGSEELGRKFVPACVESLVARSKALLERPASTGALKIK